MLSTKNPLNMKFKSKAIYHTVTNSYYYNWRLQYSHSNNKPNRQKISIAIGDLKVFFNVRAILMN